MFSIVPYLRPIYHIDQALFGLEESDEGSSRNSFFSHNESDERVSSRSSLEIDSPVEDLGEEEEERQEEEGSPYRRPYLAQLLDSQDVLITAPVANEREGDLNKEQQSPTSHSPLLVIVGNKEGVAQQAELPKQQIEATTSLSSQGE